MAEIKITREVYEKAPGPSKCVSRRQSYVGKGLKRVESRSVTSESDYANEIYVRYSEDNGKTWTEWVDVYREAYRARGGMELLWSKPESGVYNPVHDHYVALNMQRLFFKNHHESYRKFWGEAKNTFTDHSFIWVSKDLKEWKWQQVKYEDGADSAKTTGRVKATSMSTKRIRDVIWKCWRTETSYSRLRQIS